MSYDKFRGGRSRGKGRGGRAGRGGKGTDATGFGGRVRRQTPLEAEAASRDGFGERPAGDRHTGDRPPSDGWSTEAKFDVGQRIHHRIFDYRGLIFDVDPCFQGTQEWYEKMAKSRPPQDEPWYHVLVHDATHTTYVAEQNLEMDPSDEEVDHPLVSQLFDVLDDGAYLPHGDVH